MLIRVIDSKCFIVFIGVQLSSVKTVVPSNDL